MYIELYCWPETSSHTFVQQGWVYLGSERITVRCLQSRQATTRQGKRSLLQRGRGSWEAVGTQRLQLFIGWVPASKEASASFWTLLPHGATELPILVSNSCNFCLLHILFINILHHIHICLFIHRKIWEVHIRKCNQ